MVQKTNSFERFWQELKRRKTGKVIVAYAATAFIILQLSDILTSALTLPNWTTKLVIVLLVLGFLLAVMFSWIFDITPEGIKKTKSFAESEKKEINIKPARKIFTASNIVIAVLLAVVAILAYREIFKRDTLERLASSGKRICVVVMPFQNMTDDTTWNIRQDWIQDILINSLSNQKELKIKPAEDVNGTVKNRGIVNYASLSPSAAGIIARKLDADVLVYGNIKKAGTTIRLYAQLIDPKSENVFKSFQVEGGNKEEKIFQLIDSLSTEMENFLVLSNMLKKATPDDQKYLGSTAYPKAYEYSMEGDIAFTKGDFSTAINLYSQSIAIDSNYLYPYIYLSYSMAGTNLEQAKKWILKAYKKRNFMSRAQKAETYTGYGYFFETPYEMIRYIKQALDYDDQLPRCHADLGVAYNDIYQYDKAIPELEKALKIYDKWEIKPFVRYDYTGLGYAYHKTGQYNRERKVYQKAEKDFPGDDYLCYREAVLALTQKNINAANIYIEKYKSMLKENLASEPTIETSLANIYTEANLLDKGEEYLRKAHSLEPENPSGLNNLAYFLINKDRNINEGLELADKAVALSPDDCDYLHTKGWGLYKQGKYKEALEILQKSWDIRREKAIYDHEAFLHLEAAKKAVAGQKNN